MTYSTILSNQIDQRFSVLPVISLDQARRRQAARLSTWELIPRARPDSAIIVWSVDKIKTVYDNISWISVAVFRPILFPISKENPSLFVEKWKFLLRRSINHPLYLFVLREILVYLYNTENSIRPSPFFHPPY